MQRNFEPLRQQVLSTSMAKLLIYQASSQESARSLVIVEREVNDHLVMLRDNCCRIVGKQELIG